MARRDLHFMHWTDNPACDARMEKHFVGYHSIQLITRGSVRLSYGGEDAYTLSGCHVWFHYPGPLIRLRPALPTGTWHHRYVAFRGPLCASWCAAGLLAQAPLRVPADRRQALTCRLDDILGWLDENGAAPQAKALAMLEVLLWELWEIRRDPVAHHAILNALKAFFFERRFRVGGTPELARRLGLSVSSLRRRVLSETGLPIHRFVRSLRLQEARRLLKYSDASLTDIAGQLGFTDSYYFNREFTRLAGVNPGAYRHVNI